MLQEGEREKERERERETLADLLEGLGLEIYGAIVGVIMFWRSQVRPKTSACLSLNPQGSPPTTECGGILGRGQATSQTNAVTNPV